MNMGIVNFFEYLIINLLLILHVDKRQRYVLGTGRQTSFLEANEYQFLMFAYYAGSFISRSTLHSSILSKAFTPTIVQMINFTLWVFSLVKYDLFTNFYVTFFFLVWCGFPGGTAYSNFFYLANTRTTLECDFNLHFTERELTVNLLLFSNDLGIFFAGIIGFAVQAYYFPDTLYNPPSR
ncbi:hypothetical protein FGO68_gene15287 [Halteria grandinella]|uniref:Uncharacterized protein n=1 Tax=Halteria grandinella TaxID=5974 RepID=A0A8J8NDE7_HALGN|nr:hypothetical protein FGO68_gene817 [Halteria grandinella]TNV81021.1 hypothetical protein FGO68_gene15287 [Halteria grandinella]